MQIEPGLLFLHVEGIVAGVELGVALGDLNDPLGDLVDEVPVVGDGKDRPLEGLDIVFQPFHAVQVQMVGGLVQQEDIRLLQQEPCQVDPGLLPAGEAVEELGPLGWGDPQAVADLVHLYVHVVAASGLEPGHKGVVGFQLLLGGSLLHGLLQGLHLLFGCKDLPKGRPQNILHGVAQGEMGDLGDHAQLLIGIYIDLSTVIVHFPGDDLKERGLPAAVTPQDGNPLPLLDLKGKVLQQVFPDDKEFI